MATLKDRIFESSYRRMVADFKKNQGEFKEMTRVQPPSRKQYQAFFEDHWGSSKNEGAIYDQYIRSISTGRTNESAKRSYGTYLKGRRTMEKKGFSFETDSPMSPQEFSVEWHILNDAGVKNKAREVLYGERTLSQKTANKIKKFAKLKGEEAKRKLSEAEKGDIELSEEEEERYREAVSLSEAVADKNLAKEDRPRKEIYQSVASVLGYQAAEEYVYPEQAATRRRTIENPIWFTRDKNGDLFDPSGNKVRI